MQISNKLCEYCDCCCITHVIWLCTYDKHSCILWPIVLFMQVFTYWLVKNVILRKRALSEKELIEGLKQGKQEAFRLLVNRYQIMVVSTCFYFTNNHDDAQDIAQDVFVEVFISINKFRGNASISTWLYRIAVNKSLNFIKKRNMKGLFTTIEKLFDSKQTPVILHQPDSETTKENEEMLTYRQKVLYQSINALSESQRAAFTLHKFNKLSYKEIAEIMNTSLPAIESLIHRAKKQLQVNLLKALRNDK